MDASSTMPAPSSSGIVPSSTSSLTSFGVSTVLNHMDAGNADSQGDHVGYMLLSAVQMLPSFLYWIITFTSLTLPSWMFTLFSTSLTFTLNFTTIAVILLAFASTVSWLVRYKLLFMYDRLPAEPQRKEPQVDLFPDAQEGDSKPGLSNYLDEFLSAIKVFGYLERPVFHELTRTMQTKKLIAGETLLLEEEQGFCLVVDGLVQIFVKSNRPEETPHFFNGESGEASQDEDEDRYGQARQGYQLLTEVKNGAPMSSLFSILSLFTEDVKLRYDENQDTEDLQPIRSEQTTLPQPIVAIPAAGPLSPVFHSVSPAALPSGSPQGDLKHRQSSTLAKNGVYGQMGSVPHLSLDVEQPDASSGDKVQKTYAERPRHRRMMSAHPDILARATVDTTIAVIPATAFRRLTRMYPRASAHIVQVILSRLQRVTLTTGHAYLGLTSEVLRTERLMNRYTTYDLPGFLRGSALERLKEKFFKEKERTGLEESLKGIALHNPRPNRRRRSSSGIRRDSVTQARLTAVRPVSPTRPVSELTPAIVSPTEDRHGVNAGDLLASGLMPRGSAKLSHLGFSQPFHTRSRDNASNLQSGSNHFATSARSGMNLRRKDSQDEDMIFRDSILECMLKVIGLTNTKNVFSTVGSVEQSPRLVSYDSKKQKAVFNNAFGYMDPFDASIDGDSESLSSIPVSNVSNSGATSIHEELSNDVEIVFFPKDAVLVEQGERNPGLYYVIDGFLDVSVPLEDGSSDGRTFGTQLRTGNGPTTELNPKANTKQRRGLKRSQTGTQRDRVGSQAHKSLYLTKPGGLAGYLATVSSRRSFVDVTAKTDVYVGFLPRASIERIVEKYPIVLLTMAKRLTSLLPRLILHIDFALEWVQVDAGQAIYHEGDESDAIYIVLNGRLRSHRKGQNGKMQITGEYGQGDSVGELEVLTESPRPGALHAIRDTELAKLPKTLFNSLSLENPEITIKISKTIATRMRDLTENPMFESSKDRSLKPASGSVSSNINLRTVAILPVTADVPVVEFGSRLLNALAQVGTPNGVTSLNQAAILNHLGRHAFSRMGRLKLSQHLADLEEKYGLVVYVADTSVNSPWTLTCISQADCILLVGLAEGSPGIGEYERLLLTTKTTARKELVLLHAERYCPTGLTRRWLSNRTWITGSHHHIHMAFRNAVEPVHSQTRRFGSALKQRVQVLQAEIQKYTSRRVRQTPHYSADTPYKGDFHRLGRRLIGKSVGLVLGGGGSRGIAHIGIIRALEEAGIPIDIVGGTSIGAFVGALYAWDADVVPMYGRAKKFAGRMGSMWRFALDLTYPSAAYTTGHEFNRGIFKTFGTAQIEDFWLEFYCNTTNISKSQLEIHTSGLVWRYVRASMSLAGMVPPMCDEGIMLLDGGYLDNLTVAHMRSLGADVIFAIDVGSIDDNQPQQFGDSLSGFWAFINRWNPFSGYANPPTLSEIQARLAYVSSVDALERAKTMPGCRYMRPPVVEYGTLEFSKFEEIYQVGYRYGKEFLNGLREEGVLPVMEETEEKRNLRRTMAPRRASI